MDPPPAPSALFVSNSGKSEPDNLRPRSLSQASDDSQTAADFIHHQLKLEADAREALPYKFDTCTRDLGPLRQLLFACLTCNPAPASPSAPYTPAGVCYSCSVQCHGEHTLVELFNKRNFVCDCGTTRLPSTAPCTLRLNPITNQKGGVTSDIPDANNKYNHNFQNHFCGCNCDYDAEQQKGTMFQCLGLGTVEQGGCGEDWYHSSCIVGLGPTWHEDQSPKKNESKHDGTLETIAEDIAMEDHQLLTNTSAGDGGEDDADDDDLPPPPGFPHEDDFEGFICYKCVDANPWIKRYAGSQGFLGPVFKRSAAPSPEVQPTGVVNPTEVKAAAGIFDTSPSVLKDWPLDNIKHEARPTQKPSEGAVDVSTTDKSADEIFAPTTAPSRKRRASEESEDMGPPKRTKESDTNLNTKSIISEMTGTLNKLGSSESATTTGCKYEQLPPAPEGTVSLFFKSDFRDHFCRCSNCFPRMAKHPQLLEEEDVYEPPVSEDGEDAGGSTVGSGSLLDRGERALTNVDRVRAIEGVMAYNHLKEKLTPFFKEFAESGKAISAEDIKAHFAKIRGDEEAIRQAGEAAASSSNNRREQSGY